MTPEAVSRRSVLKTLGTGAGAVALLPWLSDEGLAAFVEVQASAGPPALRALTASQHATVEALVEAIIPADERSPGAKEARVADYIDLLLAEQDESIRQPWLDGLIAFEAEATKRFGAPFAQLPSGQAEALLTDLSRNERPAAGVRSRRRSRSSSSRRRTRRSTATTPRRSGSTRSCATKATRPCPSSWAARPRTARSVRTAGRSRRPDAARPHARARPFGRHRGVAPPRRVHQAGRRRNGT